MSFNFKGESLDGWVSYGKTISLDKWAGEEEYPLSPSNIVSRLIFPQK